MLNSRFLIPAILGCAGLLAGANSAEAQGYLYGYYYPDTGVFYSVESRRPYWFYTEPPPWLQSYSRANTRSYYAEPARAVANVASVRVLLPDAQAQVWFDGNRTKSTGTERLYYTPALTPGTYEYRVKCSFMQDGREVSQERTVSVTPGQTTTVDFTR
jgi:uncharacterized protein (TIGR03000 family)